MAGRVKRNNAAGAADLCKAAVVLLDNDVGKEFDGGGIGDDELGLKRFRGKHVGGDRTLALNQAIITEDASVAAIIPPLIDGDCFVISVKGGAIQDIPSRSTLDEEIAQGTIDIPKPLTSGIASVRQLVLVIESINVQGDADLPQVAHAFRAAAAFPGAGKSRQKQSGEDGDDRDDHQKFDQRKSRRRLASALR